MQPNPQWRVGELNRWLVALGAAVATILIIGGTRDGNAYTQPQEPTMDTLRQIVSTPRSSGDGLQNLREGIQEGEGLADAARTCALLAPSSPCAPAAVPVVDAAGTPAPVVAQPGPAPAVVSPALPDLPADCTALLPIVQQWTDWDWTWAMAVIWRESRCHCDSVNSQEVAGGNRAMGPFQVLEPMHQDITIGDPLTCQGGIATGHALWLADGRSPWG